MPRFFFNLVSPGLYDRDEIGCEFDCVEAAYVEGHKAAIALIAEMLLARENPGQFQFEITDEQGQFLIELPFSEVLAPGKMTPTLPALHSNLRHEMTKAHQLRKDIQDELDNVRAALKNSRAALARSRSR